MSIVTRAAGWALKTVGLKHAGEGVEHTLDPRVPPPPGVPNPNDAANAAQSETDQMRMRRGLLANIYAGGSPTAGTPVTGKAQLGT